jgi:hypothetical protein
MTERVKQTAGPSVTRNAIFLNPHHKIRSMRIAAADGYRHNHQYEAPYDPGIVPVMLRGTLRMLAALLMVDQTSVVTANRSTFHPAPTMAC